MKMGHPPREVGSLGFEPRDPSGFTEPGSDVEIHPRSKRY